MRRLGAELGVEAMSLYKHVADKDALLDGAGCGWREAVRAFAAGLRELFERHPNAAPLLATRTF